MVEDLEEEGSLGGKGTQNPRATDYKIGVRVVYLVQGVNDMHIGSVMDVHRDGEGGTTFYTVNLEGVGGVQTEGERLFPVASNSSQGPTRPLYCAPKVHGAHYMKAKRDKKAKKMYMTQMSELTQICQQQCIENNKLEKLLSD
jgi:hypothetical protein